MSVVVRRVGPDDWRFWREARLAALADAPEAFSSTLAREQRFDEATWRQRLAPETGVRAMAYLGEQEAGIVGTYLPEDAEHPELVSMWVRPAARGSGVADALVAEVVAWARERRHSEIRLWVVDNNEAARRLYLRHGFALTGETMPYPHDPRLCEQRMVRPL